MKLLEKINFLYSTIEMQELNLQLLLCRNIHHFLFPSILVQHAIKKGLKVIFFSMHSKDLHSMK